MRKIFSLFAAMMLLVGTISATTIYCKMDKSWWTQDGAAVAVHHWGGETAATAWPGVRMAPVTGEEGMWSYDVPADITGLIFVRVNGGGDVADWGAKTKDLTLPTDGKNLFTITNEAETWGDPGCDGVWSVYGAEPAYNLSEIAFTAPATADEIDADASFTVDGFTVAITDPDNKMSIDANSCRFGSAADYKMYTHRLKTGGKSSSSKNFMTLTIPEAGSLCIAVRTGSNSATDRNLVLKQGEDTIYNQVIAESMAVSVMEGETEVSVYPFVEVPVEAGTVALSYPTNGLNFYSFVFQAAGVEPQPLEWVIFGVNVPENGKPESIELFGAFGDPIALEENAETHWYLNYNVNVAASAEFSVRAAGEEQNEIYVLNGTEWKLATFKFGELWKDDTWKGDPCKMIELDLTGANYAWSVALPEGITNTTVEAAIVKTIENGQLVIIKNGVRYNAQGTIVR